VDGRQQHHNQDIHQTKGVIAVTTRISPLQIQFTKAKGRFLFRGNRPCFPIFEDPVRPPGSQLIAAPERLVFASRARTSHALRHHIRCESFLGSILKHPVA
jgi:hypothetical protein